MYSKAIANDIDRLFIELQESVKDVAASAKTSQSAADEVVTRVSKVLTNRSEAVLSDMLSFLSKDILKSPEFSTVEKQLAFQRVNLYDEIKSKYNFVVEDIKYQEASKIVHYLIIPVGVGAGAGVASSGIIKIGTVLGLALSSASPAVPVSIAIAGCLGMFLLELLKLEPQCNRKKFFEAIKTYLVDTKHQFCHWLNEVENYFNKRVDEIKRTL